jgi:hypothetical protein
LPPTDRDAISKCLRAHPCKQRKLLGPLALAPRGRRQNRSEAHAAGQPLFGPGGLVPAYNVSLGLRTVDGTYNHLLPGQETWGAANQPFPEPLGTNYRPADGTLFDPDGPGPAPAMPTAPNYNPSNNPNSLVFDSSLRTISNLLVDQTLGNPAAVLTALERAGSADPMADLAAITPIYQAFKPAFDAEYGARRDADRQDGRGRTRRWQSCHTAECCRASGASRFG